MSNPWLCVKDFEQSICNYTGSKYAVAVDSCTNAIFLSLIYYKKFINKKDITITIPSRTYISVPMQIINAGYKLNLIDYEWVGSYKLKNTPIIDSAQNFTKDMYIKDTFQCISFQFKKHLPIGRGGAILTDDVNAYEWLIKARHDGRNMYNEYGSIGNIDIIGYHCPLLPNEAIKGLELLFNQNLTSNNIPGRSTDYPIINKNLFK